MVIGDSVFLILSPTLFTITFSFFTSFHDGFCENKLQAD